MAAYRAITYVVAPLERVAVKQRGKFVSFCHLLFRYLYRYAGIVVWLFLRPVGFDCRSKLANPRWRSAWDWALFAGGTAPNAQLGTLSSMASPPINPGLIPVMFFPLVTGSRS